jgi:hypothetical protein
LLRLQQAAEEGDEVTAAEFAKLAETKGGDHKFVAVSLSPEERQRIHRALLLLELVEEESLRPFDYDDEGALHAQNWLEEVSAASKEIP